MELLIDKCKEVIDELAQPDEHTGVKTIKQHPLLAEKREILSTAHAQLLSWRQKLQRHWQITESQIVADARLMKNERKLKKVNSSFADDVTCVVLIDRILILDPGLDLDSWNTAREENCTYCDISIRGQYTLHSLQNFLLLNRQSMI